jgi:hypothetical protein
MTIPADSIVAHTLSRMQRISNGVQTLVMSVRSAAGFFLWEMYMMRFPTAVSGYPSFATG